MDALFGLLGEGLALSLHPEGRIEDRERDLAAALCDASSATLRSALRSVLLDLGCDPSELGDVELRQRLFTLLDERRLFLVRAGALEFRWGSQIEQPEPSVPEPAEPPGPDDPAEQTQKYKLVELVEVVDRGAPGTVGGAAGDSALLPKHLDRSEKDGGDFKQFINLGRDIEGAANRRPDYGRTIELRARIEWTSGDAARPLGGRAITWKLIVLPHPSIGRPATFAVAGERCGLGGANDTLELVSTTDGQGWARATLHTSQYAGDKFRVTAEVDAGDPDAIAGPPLKAGPYVVWRKFWYQMTKPDGSAVPAPADAIAAYQKIAADMLEADVVAFKKTDVPAPPARTFYPRGMATTGSADATDIALIGGHNRSFFWGKYTTEAAKPVKGHLIICDGQWDPAGESSLQVFDMPAASQTITVDIGGASNAGILTPALAGAVLRAAKWRVKAAMRAKYSVAPLDPTLPPRPAAWEGALSDTDLSIPLPRAALNEVTITLPAACPDPTVYSVEVVLKVHYGKFWGGESVGVNMLIKYTTGTNVKAYTQTVAHELGHGFKQTPDKSNSLSMADHAKQYDHHDGHGGQGSHCSEGSSTGPVSTHTPNGRFMDGTCIMFHQLSPSTCTQKFCTHCDPHLRLQSFASLS